MSTNCHKCYSREQTYKLETQKSSLSRHTLIERRMLLERLPTEVQLSKQRSMRAIHVLAVCQYHIHHLPVHLCCASKTKTLLLIYNLNFEVHPVYPWILVLFIARNSRWSVSQSYLQIIPSDFQSTFCLFYEGGLPFSLNSDSFLSASTPRPPFLPSCRHSSTQFSLLFVRVSQDWATVGAWVNLKTAVLIRWRTETLCSVNNFIKASHRRRLWIFAKKMWRNSKLSTQRHTRSPSTYLGAYLLLTHSFTCSRFFIEWAESPHKGRKLSVTLNKKKKAMNCCY